MDFDFLSSNLQIAYPFRDSVDVARPDGNENINGLVAALRMYTSDQREDQLLLDAVDIRSSDGFTTVDTAKLTLRWANEYAQFTLESGVNAVAKSTVYGSWVAVRWRHTTDDLVFHLIFPYDAADEQSSSSSSSSSSSDGPDVSFRFWKYLDDILVLSSLVKQGPAKVKRVYTKQGSTLTQLTGPGEELSVQPGFNMEIEQGTPTLAETGRKLTRVAINAVPGAGLGRYLICDGAAYLRTLNGVVADDNGALSLGPEECYWLDIPLASGPTPVTPQHNIQRVATLTPYQVRLRNACGACCSCEDYVKIYDHLRWIWDNPCSSIPIREALERCESSSSSDRRASRQVRGTH